MSTALITALRESCGYLRDDGYHQTARLLDLAADEISRLNEHVRMLEGAAQPRTASSAGGALDRLRAIARAEAGAARPAARRMRSPR